MVCILSLHPSLSWKLTRSSQLRLYPRLDSAQPQDIAESIAGETIQMLRALIGQFVRGLVRPVITLRECDFALSAHTNMWRLSNMRPLHVRRVLELGGSGGGLRLRSSKGAHFEALLERSSECEGSSDSDDAPLAVCARIWTSKATARDEDEDDEDEDEIDDIGDSNQEQQQQAGPSTVAQAHDATAIHWSPHHTMYTPFVHAPDLIPPAHPFGIYVPGTTRDLPSCSTLFRAT